MRIEGHNVAPGQLRQWNFDGANKPLYDGDHFLVVAVDGVRVEIVGGGSDEARSFYVIWLAERSRVISGA